MGEFPPCAFDGRYESVRRYEAHGLSHEDIKFNVLPGYGCEGAIVYPADTEGSKLPSAVCIHETDVKLGLRNALSPETRPDRAYGIELCRRGYVTIAVDQFGFGGWAKTMSEQECYDKLAREYPDWSLDGMQLMIQQCAVGILSNHPRVDKERVSCLGHSLGGRTAVFLAALDERVKAAWASTGVSPNATNVFRNFETDPAKSKSPRLNGAVLKTGLPPWEYEELLALVAPRGLTILEPFNDLYNQDIEATVLCCLKASKVYKLLGAAGNFSLVCHGRGHDTPAEMRTYAYALLDHALGVK
jgi:dienelactone hydrolase